MNTTKAIEKYYKEQYKKQAEKVVEQMRQKLVGNRKEIDNITILSVTMSFAVILSDKFGWSPEEINRLIAYSTEQFDSISKKYLTLDDLLQLAKEMGVVGV